MIECCCKIREIEGPGCYNIMEEPYTLMAHVTQNKVIAQLT